MYAVWNVLVTTPPTLSLGPGDVNENVYLLVDVILMVTLYVLPLWITLAMLNAPFESEYVVANPLACATGMEALPARSLPLRSRICPTSVNVGSVVKSMRLE